MVDEKEVINLKETNGWVYSGVEGRKRRKKDSIYIIISKK